MQTKAKFEKIVIDVFLKTQNIDLSMKTNADISIDETFDREVEVLFYSEPEIKFNGETVTSYEEIKKYEHFISEIIFYKDVKWKEIKGDLSKIGDFKTESDFINEFPNLFGNIKKKKTKKTKKKTPTI